MYKEFDDKKIYYLQVLALAYFIKSAVLVNSGVLTKVICMVLLKILHFEHIICQVVNIDNLQKSVI